MLRPYAAAQAAALRAAHRDGRLGGVQQRGLFDPNIDSGRKSGEEFRHPGATPEEELRTKRAQERMRQHDGPRSRYAGDGPAPGDYANRFSGMHREYNKETGESTFMARPFTDPNAGNNRDGMGYTDPRTGRFVPYWNWGANSADRLKDEFVDMIYTQFRKPWDWWYFNGKGQVGPPDWRLRGGGGNMWERIRDARTIHSEKIKGAEIARSMFDEKLNSKIQKMPKLKAMSPLQACSAVQTSQSHLRAVARQKSWNTELHSGSSYYAPGLRNSMTLGTMLGLPTANLLADTGLMLRHPTRIFTMQGRSFRMFVFWVIGGAIVFYYFLDTSASIMFRQAEDDRKRWGDTAVGPGAGVDYSGMPGEPWPFK